MKRLFWIFSVLVFVLVLVACGVQPATGPLTLNSVTFGASGSNMILTTGTGTVNVPVTVSISGFAPGSTIQYVATVISGSTSVKGSGSLQNPTGITDLTLTQTYAINTNVLTKGTGTWGMYLLASNPTFTSNTVTGTFTVN